MSLPGWNRQGVTDGASEPSPPEEPPRLPEERRRERLARLMAEVQAGDLVIADDAAGFPAAYRVVMASRSGPLYVVLRPLSDYGDREELDEEVDR